jgi:vault protein inter-alpha-trypsin-like protein/VWA domain-containing protein
MPTMAAIDNPLGKFCNGATASADGREWPIPLASTHVAVTIRGGLAIVTTERTFRNAESRSIEAKLTFPIPVDATLCALSARIDGRTLHAEARGRGAARTTYEGAIDRGHAAVLHEELIRGVHMLSVGQIRPGAEIAVSATWTAPLSFSDGVPRLRIPTTIGEIYGQSPLAPAHDLVTADVVHPATIGITCEDGVATLIGAGAAIDGRYSVTLDHPIDIVVSGFTPRTLRGVAADGRAVELTIEPIPRSEEPLVVDVLFDRSGSMMERASGDRETVGSKFEVAKAGLLAVARTKLKSGDRLRLWQFNDNVAELGEATGTRIATLIEKLDEATGGTEIGRAFNAVAAKSKSRNVVIITDGKSWAFDPQAVARGGLRVTAVLIGEDALEGGVADLAGISGGQIFVAAGSDIASTIVAAFDAARAPHRPSPRIEGPLARVEALRRGARLTATWGATTQGMPSADARLIGATAAMLAIPLLESAAAADLAVAEGIVCHLTSLVLVDDAGARHEGVPAPRVVPLSTPRTFHVGGAMPCAAPPPDARHNDLMADCYVMESAERDRSAATGRRLSGWLRRGRKAEAAPPSKPAANRPTLNLGRVLARIDWDADPDALRRGDLHRLAPDMTALIWEAARLPAVDALAWSAGLDPVIAVIALLAKAAGKANRSANRLARSLLHNADGGAVERALAELGLKTLSPTS